MAPKTINFTRSELFDVLEVLEPIVDKALNESLDNGSVESRQRYNKLVQLYGKLALAL